MTYQRSGRQRAARKTNQQENNKMAIADSLLQQAEQIALHQQNRVAGLEHEIAELEAQLAQKNLALNAARMAHQRLGNFVPQLGADFNCPRCWIENELVAALDPSGATS